MAHVGIVSVRGIPNRYGGFERLVEVLAPHLVSTGREVTVFCEAQPGDPEQDLWNGVHRRFLPRRLPGPAGTLGYDVESILRLQKGSVALVFGYGTAIWHAQLFRNRGIPHCVNMDGIEWQRAKWGRLAREWIRLNEGHAVRKADVVIADHPEIQRSLADRFGAKSRMIAYGVGFLNPAEPVPLHPLLETCPDMGFHLIIARPEPENQIRLLLGGWAAAGKGLPMLVIGDFASTDYGRALIADFPDARFVGPVYDAAVLNALRRRASTYLHGHSVGGTNPSLIEAMAAGGLVVAHDNPFNRWVLGEGGLFFSDAAGLARILGDAPEGAVRARMIEAAAERCRADFLWPHILAEYTAIVEDLEAMLPR
jgi:glycosyltransferase involved in cell wall biosynthesis